MKRVLYAAYGSNLHPLRLARRVPSAQLLGTAHLPSRALEFHKRSTDGSAKCTILEPGDGVHVAVYEFLTIEKAELDDIEGVGIGYDHSSVDVPGFGRCYTYVATSTHTDDGLRPYDWYRELVILGCYRHGFPEDYVARIESIATDPDPNDKRSRQNWEIVQLLRRTG